MTQLVSLPNIGHELAEAIDAELSRAREKFPRNDHLTHALMEEVGELAQAELQARPRHVIRAEAIQVAAVAIRIAAEGDSDFDGYAGKP